MSGELVRCRQGHVFDLTQHAACPVCGEGVAKPLQPSPATNPQPTEWIKTAILRLKKLVDFANVRSRPILVAGGAAACVALLGFAAMLLWPRSGPVPPSHDDKKQAQNKTGSQDEKSGKTTSAPVSNGNNKAKTTPASTIPAPAHGQNGEETLILDPPRPPVEGPAFDFRDPLALAFEEKYAFSPLARELLATTRGYMAYTRKDYWKAKAWFTLGPGKANPAATYWYAIMQQNGEGLPQDYGAALNGITTAAEAGFYTAQLRLAEVYLKGAYPALPADPEKGKSWLIRAAKEGRPEASRLAAEVGLKDSDIGASIMTLDHALGRSYQDAFPVAQALLADKTTSGYYWTGTFAFYGQGTKPDKERGRDLLLTAARLYSVPALINAAHWAADGFKAQKNPVEAAALAYLARVNCDTADEVQRVDKVIAPLVANLSPEQYQDLGFLLKGIIELPQRQGAR